MDAGASGCMPEGSERSCGSDVGECVAGQERCEGGAWSTCRGGVGPETEVCDGLNNDCDGASDEGCPCTGDQMRSCGTDEGACQAGVQACAGGNWGSCQGDIEPGSEYCATPLDEDCDGTANEGCTCEDGATQACGSDVGACARGLATCAAGRWGDCIGETPANVEGCNGADDDCDGSTDEGCPCVGGAVQECGTSTGACVAGSQACIAGAWGPCEGGTPPVDETCDGGDDDCDGATDEGGNACGGVCSLTPPVGSACDGSDSDHCLDDAQACGGANALLCSTGDDDVEVCNGLDDDCANGCDDAFSCCAGASRACTTACGSAGTETCTAACAWGSCAPPAELCDGDDDDCDTVIDEGFGLCMSCCDAASDADQCNDDQVSCTGCVDVGGTLVEACNGADDDCDTATDEGFGLCTGCCDAASDADRCNDDQVTCAGCQDVGGSVVEVCNGADEDCDTAIDEGFGLCTGCCDAASDTDQCNDDQVTCAGCQDVGGSLVEVCNGADEDCDGRIDEGSNGCGGVCPLAPAPGTACDAASDLDDCMDDAYACSGLNAVVCANGGADADGDGYSAGSSGCAYDCNDSYGWISPVGAEACNGVDDDCNGAVDEGSLGFDPLPVGLALLFTRSCPAGWSEVVSARNRFIRGHDGIAPYGQFGGSNGHSHTLSAHTHGTTSAAIPSHSHSVTIQTYTPTNTSSPGTSANTGIHAHSANGSPSATGGAHSHTLPADAGSVPSDSELPAYREFVVCRNDSAGVLAVPGATRTLAVVAADCGAGPWWASIATDGRLLRGDGGDGIMTTGGADDHTHANTHSHGGSTTGTSTNHGHGPWTSGPPLSTQTTFGGASGYPAASHTHSISLGFEPEHSHTAMAWNLDVTTASRLPPFIETAMCQAALPACVPNDIVGLFDADCPAGWTEVVAYRNRFVRGEDGDGAESEVGGSAQHSHLDIGHSHGTVTGGAHNHAFTMFTGSASPNTAQGSGGGALLYAPGHSHGLTSTVAGAHTHTSSLNGANLLSFANNEPAWREFVMCRRVSGGAGCGDGVCGASESCTTCPLDCGLCACGDGACDGAAHENCATCPADCTGC